VWALAFPAVALRLGKEAVEALDIGHGQRLGHDAVPRLFEIFPEPAEVNPVLEPAVGDGSQRLDWVPERLVRRFCSFGANARRRSRCF